MNNAGLRNIKSLLEFEFIIPSYQRGYRWTPRQVRDLLDDILEFSAEATQNYDFYCLQPLVVKKDEDKYIVIDAQQRLTTIYLILKYLNQENLKIEYERNNGVSKIDFENDNAKNKSIESYHLYNAFKAVKDYFNEKNKEINLDEFCKKLLHQAKFIWYEIGDENEREIFSRLNIGKIPLTNAELIKALFLINIKDKNKKIILTNAWDIMEKRLSDDGFFCFLNKDKQNLPTRIDFIFDLVADEKLNKNLAVKIPDDEPKKSFYVFNELLKDKNDEEKTMQIWNEVKTYMRIFEEIYEDNENYHSIGFLINSKILNIKDILANFKENNKDKFIKNLKNKINEKIEINKIENLDYENNYNEILEILLFNIILTKNCGYSKFPFDLYQKEKYSIEHINPQNPKTMSIEEEIKYLENLSKYMQNLNDDKIKKELENEIKEELENAKKQILKTKERILRNCKKKFLQILGKKFMIYQI